MDMGYQKQQQTALAVNGITKTFGKNVALDEVSFTVPTASFTVILGPAGAGKTTTLRTIAGLDSPDAGEVVINGRNVDRWEPKDRNLAMIFDNLALYPSKTGFENIASPLVVSGAPKERIREKVAEIAATLQISRILNRLPKTMSGGERQRIALGRALIRTPDLFLLDEPLSSLDAQLRVELRAELRRLQRDHGRTFLMATPDYNEALAIADTVIMLRNGRVVQIAPPQTLYDFPADPEVASFVGAPQVNILKTRYETDAGKGVIRIAGESVTAPDHFNSVFSDRPGEFDLGIRPENLRLSESSKPDLSARVTDIEALGLKSVVTVSHETAELRMLVDTERIAGMHLSLNDRVGVDLANPSKMLAFDPETGRRLAPAGT